MPDFECAPAELWSKYHEPGILQRSEANLWWAEQYAEWDPCQKFDDTYPDRGYWAVSIPDISSSM